MELEIQYQWSEDRGELAAALAVLQSKAGDAEMTGKNPGFKRDGKPAPYMQLKDAWKAIRAPLGDLGLAVIQLPAATSSGPALVTELIHKSNQWVRATVLLPVDAQAGAQKVGAAITYLRRYCLLAVCGIADDDDDGNSAQQSPPRQRTDQRRNGSGPQRSYSRPPDNGGWSNRGAPPSPGGGGGGAQGGSTVIESHGTIAGPSARDVAAANEVAAAAALCGKLTDELPEGDRPAAFQATETARQRGDLRRLRRIADNIRGKLAELREQKPARVRQELPEPQAIGGGN